MVRSERTTRRFYEGCGKVHAPVSMLFPPIDPNERFRERRAAVRRRKRLRRGAAVGSVLLAVLLLGMGAQFVGSESSAEPVTDLATLAATPDQRAPHAADRAPRGARDDGSRVPSREARRVPRARAATGLTALELDVKDENGEIGFITPSVPLARLDRRCARLLRRARRRAARARARRLPRRADRRLRGPGALPCAARPRDPAHGRLGLARRRRARLDEPVRPARLEVQRRRRRRRRPSGLRRDHVRLRPLPVRRRRGRRRLPQRARSRSARPFPRSCATPSAGSSRSA